MAERGETRPVEQWATVEYRLSRVDLSKFEQLDLTPDGDVEGAWFDRDHHYMVITLSGVNYHYCAFNALDVRRFEVAASAHQHYRDHIRGTHDCRVVGEIPDYGSPASYGFSNTDFDRDREREAMIESLQDDLGRGFDEDLDFDLLVEIDSELDDLERE